MRGLGVGVERHSQVINAARQMRGMIVWQSSYYERIICDDELNRIRKYIAENPYRWVPLVSLGAVG